MNKPFDDKISLQMWSLKIKAQLTYIGAIAYYSQNYICNRHYLSGHMRSFVSGWADPLWISDKVLRVVMDAI